MKNSFYRYSQFYNKLYKNPDEYVVACNYFNVIKSHYNYFFYPKKIKFIKSFFNFFFRYLKKRKKNNVKKKKILIISNIFLKMIFIFHI